MKSDLSAERLEQFDGFLIELNEAAAQVTLPLFRTGHDVKDKGGRGFDPVTEADTGAERAIRALIAERFPDHGVVGEEYGADRPDAEFVWVLDPVDGTRSFVSGLPLWCTLIGLKHQGEPVLGSISQPYVGELFIGSPAGARLMSRGESRPLRVRPCASLLAATIAATDPDLYYSDTELEGWRRVSAAARLRRLGGDAYIFALVAAGCIDAVIESGLNPWDVNAIVPVIEGAGGRMTDWRGDRLAARAGQVIAAGDDACLSEVVAMLSPAAV